MSYKFWTKIFIFTSIIFFIFSATFNYIINPYDIFKHNLFTSFIQIKNHSVSERMSTFYYINNSKPTNLMIGTSRIGIFSTNSVEKYLGKNTYNMSIPGANIEEQTSYLRFMAYKHNIKNVVWALDFFSFNPDLKNDKSFTYDRVNPFKQIKDDHLIALFSLQTLKNSFKTLLDNINNKGPILNRKQLKKNVNSMYLSLNKKDIEMRTNIQINYYSNKFLKYTNFNNQDSIKINILKVKKILDLYKEKNINIYIYTSPVQDSFLDLYKKLGLEKTFLQWKKDLQTITPYTDFCTYNSISKEKTNFIDGTHIMPTFESMIFAKIFHDKSINIPSDFGIYKEKK